MTRDRITLHRLAFDPPVGKDLVLGAHMPGAHFGPTCITVSRDPLETNMSR